MLQQLEKAIGYEFRDKSLLAMALVRKLTGKTVEN